MQSGVREGDLTLVGGGDPTLVVENFWLLLQRLRGLGLREIRGDLVLDRSEFSLPPHDPAEFDNEPLRPYNVAPDALLLNYKSVVMTFVPDRTVATAQVPIMAWCSLPMDMARTSRSTSPAPTALPLDDT